MLSSIVALILSLFSGLVISLSPQEEINVLQKKDAISKKLQNRHNFIDDYHFPMVADEVRNLLFYSALEKAIVPNVSKVLDVSSMLHSPYCILYNSSIKLHSPAYRLNDLSIGFVA
jgi:hypothetical protein